MNGRLDSRFRFVPGQMNVTSSETVCTTAAGRAVVILYILAASCKIDDHVAGKSVQKGLAENRVTSVSRFDRDSRKIITRTR